MPTRTNAESDGRLHRFPLTERPSPAFPNPQAGQPPNGITRSTTPRSRDITSPMTIPCHYSGGMPRGAPTGVLDIGLRPNTPSLPRRLRPNLDQLTPRYEKSAAGVRLYLKKDTDCIRNSSASAVLIPDPHDFHLLNHSRSHAVVANSASVTSTLEHAARRTLRRSKRPYFLSAI